MTVMDYSINTTQRPEDGIEETESDSDQQNADTRPLFKEAAPNDRFYVCYIVFYVFGITSLLPWNFFITADSYWMYKLRDTQNLTSTNKTDLQKEFTSYISIASVVPNTIFLILCIFINRICTLSFRMVSSLLVTLAFFLLTTVMVEIDMDRYENLFFIVTLVTTVILNISSAVFSSNVFAMLSKFSPMYMAGFVKGQALSGMFAALMQIFSLSLGESADESGLIYFSIGNLLCFSSLIGYLILIKSPFCTYHLSRDDHRDDGQRRLFSNVFKKMWVDNVSAMLVFGVTLMVYPAVSSLVESEYKNDGGAWPNRYFTPVICFLLFTSCDFIGRCVAAKYEWFSNRPCFVLFLCVLRLVFIPLVMLCNAQPRTYLPVVFTHDWEYIVITICFAFTNGYLANIVLANAPTRVDKPERETASLVLSAFLGIGLSIGSLCSLLFVKLL